MQRYTVEIEEFTAGAIHPSWEWDHDFMIQDDHSVEVWRNQQGQAHKLGGPAVIIRNLGTGQTLGEVWYKNGRCHRDENDAPARIFRDDLKSMLVWCKNGLEHRDHGPARLYMWAGAVPRVLSEEWIKAGKQHRIGGPARTVQGRRSSIIHEEEWFVDGKQHRADGPAVIFRDPDNGMVIEEEWYIHGALHRENGPAMIERSSETGQIIEQHHYRNGVETPQP